MCFTEPVSSSFLTEAQSLRIFSMCPLKQINVFRKPASILFRDLAWKAHRRTTFEVSLFFKIWPRILPEFLFLRPCLKEKAEMG